MRIKNKVAMASIIVPLVMLAQDTVPELTGTVAFNVDSKSGRVERLAVTIGDGGTGQYKAILMGEPSLPTHGIYRPRDLRPFGGQNLLPIVAFGNGGCRNTSGEFRNFLSDVASQGFLVVAIGPAGNAVVMGSEERTNTTISSQLLDGVTWAIAENARAGGAYYQKLDVSKVAVSGQSCGAGQAIEVSSDPRVTTTIALNQGINTGTANAGRGPAAAAPTAPAANRGGAGARGGAAAPADPRYAPFAPPLVRAPVDPAVPLAAVNRAEMLEKLHGPILFLNGGPSDSGHRTAKGNFDAIQNVPAVHAHTDVGHYPATYRQPNGGDFARVVGTWLKWQLKGDQIAGKMFVGSACGLCTDPKWTIERKMIAN
jgi:dienelactone hydrolase